MNGIVIINKEKGCTSHDVVYKIKKMFGEKVGHTGTLDPNATGVLPILIGKGTQLSQFLINHDKKYVATIKLGIKTDTADSEGVVIEERDVNLQNVNVDNLNKIFDNMIGKQKQVPPMYSAIKINGKKLYEYARSGKSVYIPEREIEIYYMNLIDIDETKMLITFEIFCSKGTYIRTVCEKIAEALGTVGYMKELKRTVVGKFKIEDSITIKELENNMNNQNFLKENVIGIEDFFEEKSQVILNKKQLNLFLNGVMITKDCEDDIVRVYDENKAFIGIGICIDGILKRKVILD